MKQGFDFHGNILNCADLGLNCWHPSNLGAREPKWLHVSGSQVGAACGSQQSFNNIKYDFALQ